MMLLRCFLWFLGLVGLWVAVVVTGVLPRPNTDQRAALELLRVPVPPLGRSNAFAALWLGRWDIPEAERDGVMRADLAVWERSRGARPINDELPPFESTAKGHYAALPRTDGVKSLCAASLDGCLEQVRADPEAASVALGRFAALRDKGEELSRYDHVAMGFPLTPETPIPAMGGYASISLTAAAVKFHAGDRVGAMQDLCRFAGTWRGLRAHTDHLVVSMVGAAYVSGAVRLAGEMLAMSGETPWPEACEAAFAPLEDAELDQCAEFKAEFRSMRSYLARIAIPRADKSKLWAANYKVLMRGINFTHAEAVMAPSYALFCGEPARRREAKRQRLDPMEVQKVAPSCSVIDHAFNPVGCYLAKVGAPIETAKYYHSLLDLDARLKLLQTVRWLRTQPQDNLDASLAARPAELQTPLHAVLVDADRRHLVMAMLDERPDRKTWRIPYAPAQPVPDETGSPPTATGTSTSSRAPAPAPSTTGVPARQR